MVFRVTDGKIQFSHSRHSPESINLRSCERGECEFVANEADAYPWRPLDVNYDVSEGLVVIEKKGRFLAAMFLAELFPRRSHFMKAGPLWGDLRGIFSASRNDFLKPRHFQEFFRSIRLNSTVGQQFLPAESDHVSEIEVCSMRLSKFDS
jgi:hypothetical protein